MEWQGWMAVPLAVAYIAVGVGAALMATTEDAPESIVAPSAVLWPIYGAIFVAGRLWYAATWWFTLPKRWDGD